MITLGTLSLQESRDSKKINIRSNIRTKRSYANDLYIFKDDETRKNILISFEVPTCQDLFDDVQDYILANAGVTVTYTDHRGNAYSVRYTDDEAELIKTKRQGMSFSLNLEVVA